VLDRSQCIRRLDVLYIHYMVINILSRGKIRFVIFFSLFQGRSLRMLRPISHEETFSWVLMCYTQLLAQIYWLPSEVQRKNVEGKLNQASLGALAQLYRANASDKLAELFCHLTFSTLQQVTSIRRLIKTKLYV